MRIAYSRVLSSLGNLTLCLLSLFKFTKSWKINIKTETESSKENYTKREGSIFDESTELVLHIIRIAPNKGLRSKRQLFKAVPLTFIN